MNWNEKCEGPSGGIDGVHYAPGFTLVLFMMIDVYHLSGLISVPGLTFGIKPRSGLRDPF